VIKEQLLLVSIVEMLFVENTIECGLPIVVGLVSAQIVERKESQKETRFNIY